MEQDAPPESSTGAAVSAGAEVEAEDDTTPQVRKEELLARFADSALKDENGETMKYVVVRMKGESCTRTIILKKCMIRQIQTRLFVRALEGEPRAIETLEKFGKRSYEHGVSPNPYVENYGPEGLPPLPKEKTAAETGPIPSLKITVSEKVEVVVPTSKEDATKAEPASSEPPRPASAAAAATESKTDEAKPEVKDEEMKPPGPVSMAKPAARAVAASPLGRAMQGPLRC